MDNNLNSSTGGRAALIHCSEYRQELTDSSVRRIFDCFGGIDKFIQKGSRVLIKPNLIAPSGPEQCAQTHPEVILSVVRLVRDFGAVPFVGDSSAWGNAQACIRALGIEQDLAGMGVEVCNLDRPVSVKIEGVKVGISRVALEADAIINLPKFKAHQQLGATFAIKNMYGCVAGLMGKEKAWWHFAKGKDQQEFCRLLVGVYRRLNPVFTIIDGIIAMEGPGPIHGIPRPLGVLIGGTDPIACETVCAKIAGFGKSQLPLLAAAEEMAGRLHETITICGDPVEPVIAADFKYPRQIPVLFSLPRIGKSILKQCGVMIRKSFSARPAVEND